MRPRPTRPAHGGNSTQPAPVELPSLARFPVRCRTSGHLPSLRRAAEVGASRLNDQTQLPPISDPHLRELREVASLSMRFKHSLASASSTPVGLAPPGPRRQCISVVRGRALHPSRERDWLQLQHRNRPDSTIVRAAHRRGRIAHRAHGKGLSRPRPANKDSASGGRGTSRGFRDAPRGAGRCSDYTWRGLNCGQPVGSLFTELVR